jgi:pyrimidine-specific ribonucleoside hydrolase
MSRMLLTRSMWMIVVLALVGCGATTGSQPITTSTPATAENPHHVIIDTDMAADDWMAILYLLNSSNVAIEAITVTGAGEAHCEPGMRHALGLVALAGERDIPVACGRETPLKGDHVFPKSWRDAVDNLNGLELPEGENPSEIASAVELLTDIVQASPGKIVLLTLGPLTNVAEALQNTPTLAEDLAAIFIMGGAVDVSGNIDDSRIGNRTAEWNLYVDPYAAKIVLESGAAVTLVPLDATNHARVTPEFYHRLEDNRTTAEATFVYDLLTKNYGFVTSGGYYFWDPLAAALVTDEDLATFEMREIRLIDEEGDESGRTKPVNRGASVRVAVSADGERFEQRFLDTLNGQEP